MPKLTPREVYLLRLRFRTAVDRQSKLIHQRIERYAAEYAALEQGDRK